MQIQAIRREDEETQDNEPQPASHRGLPARREEKAIELCEGMIDIAAALYNVSSKELREPGRASLPVSRVRQIAMYVAHVVCGLTMREVGAGFGRDRTTVLYACHLIEDLRDDEDFDRIIGLTERVAKAALLRRPAI